MRTLLYCTLLIISSLFYTLPMHAQTASALEVVQQQLDHYNAQDLEGFVSVFASDAKVYYNIADTEPRLTGHDQIRAAYGKLFSDYPENRSVLQGIAEQHHG